MKKSILILICLSVCLFFACDLNSTSVINIAAIKGIIIPDVGEKSVAAIIETAQYGGTVSWSPIPEHSAFAAETEYTATITLQPKAGYILKGVKENFFTVDGATVSYSADSNTITAKFPKTGEGKIFWAPDLTTNTYYSLGAQLKATETHCNVWVDKKVTTISENLAKQIAAKYESEIYIKLVKAFGLDKFYSNDLERDFNIMDLANLYGSGDGKFTILLLDIKDGYKAGVDDAYVAGLFVPSNFSDGDNNLNGPCDMIYMDINPAKPEDNEWFETLAHESQHMMNFVVTMENRDSNNMDTWIDEGLSSAAEWLYSGVHPQTKIDWYNRGGSSDSIAKGNNFFVWDEKGDFDDYATVYLFFQWLRLQTKDTINIYESIINSFESDYVAVENAAEDGGITDFEMNKLLGTWHVANYVNNSTGIYGYKNDTALRNINANTTNSTNLNLYPGEGVYSAAKAQPDTTGQGDSIENLYLVKTVGIDNPKDSWSSDKDILLTYNGNVEIEGTSEAAFTTGVAASIAVNGSRSIAEPIGPYKISASEALRRNGADTSGFETIKVNRRGN